MSAVEPANRKIIFVVVVDSDCGHSEVKKSNFWDKVPKYMSF